MYSLQVVKTSSAQTKTIKTSKQNTKKQIYTLLTITVKVSKLASHGLGNEVLASAN